jgi:hypothetical protein
MDLDTLIIIIAVLIVTNMACLIVLFERRSHKPVVTKSSTPVPPPAKLSEETIARLEQQTQAAFESSVQRASQHFNQDLDVTSQKLSELIVRLTTSVVEEELSQYRKGLVAARASALQSLASMQKTVEEQQTVLQADMQAAIKNRQAELLQRLDKKIGVVVTNYIVEALGQGVDLGAQREYLLASLERNKDALKKDISGEL